MSKNNKKKKTPQMNFNRSSQYNSQNAYNNSQLEHMNIQYQMQNQTYNSQKVQQVVDNEYNTNQAQNQMIQNAVNFAQGNEQHFIAFCNRYKIDYRKNYNNAALRYYQAYLRSLKQ